MTITVSGNRDFQIRGLAFLAFAERLPASWPIRSRILVAMNDSAKFSADESSKNTYLAR